MAHLDPPQLAATGKPLCAMLTFPLGFSSSVSIRHQFLRRPAHANADPFHGPSDFPNPSVCPRVIEGSNMGPKLPFSTGNLGIGDGIRAIKSTRLSTPSRSVDPKGRGLKSHHSAMPSAEEES